MVESWCRHSDRNRSQLLETWGQYSESDPGSVESRGHRFDQNRAPCWLKVAKVLTNTGPRGFCDRQNTGNRRLILQGWFSKGVQTPPPALVGSWGRNFVQNQLGDVRQYIFEIQRGSRDDSKKGFREDSKRIQRGAKEDSERSHLYAKGIAFKHHRLSI